MQALLNKKVLLGITGSIAAYKAVALSRRLVAAGAEVQVVMTAAAGRFVTPMTLAAITGHPVRDSLWDEDAELAMGHIELARWADVVLIAPASADTLARLAQGRASDLLSTLCLATTARVVVAPAMNHVMWHHPATRRNLALFEEQGGVVIGPEQGALAERESGVGRMSEPAVIQQRLCALLTPRHGDALAGRRIVITAGPTREMLDPVRYLTNRSSGRMGYALAASCVAAGALVVLVSGPTECPLPSGVEVMNVESAAQMHDAVMARIASADIFIGAAAVADYRPVEVAPDKIKKSPEENTLVLTRTRDIIADVARLFPDKFTLGFAAETRDMEASTRAKRERKALSMIAGNTVGPGVAFGQEDNELFVAWEGGDRHLPRGSKRELADSLVALMAEQLGGRQSIQAEHKEQTGK